MAQTRRGAAAGGGNDTESGSGGSHTAGTDTGSTQGEDSSTRKGKRRNAIGSFGLAQFLHLMAHLCISWF
ncbi:hypothetical protein PVAP13_7KG025358 [Panicum virgatum]|uniref:Uncharacterized protein n=1 Tax=Panicum virgatum TaxID=38727 RepID=A0A8T0Q7V0_PANVG|nr:hypothetical protein PVAP13_7KG025358 [Panicum virgatum]